MRLHLRRAAVNGGGWGRNSEVFPSLIESLDEKCSGPAPTHVRRLIQRSRARTQNADDGHGCPRERGKDELQTKLSPDGKTRRRNRIKVWLYSARYKTLGCIAFTGYLRQRNIPSSVPHPRRAICSGKMQKSDLDNANPTILNVSQLPSRAQKRSTTRLGVDSKYDRLVLPNQHWSDTSSDDGEGYEELADDALDEQEIYGERPRTAYSVQQRRHTTHCTKHIRAALAPVPKPIAQRPAPPSSPPGRAPDKPTQAVMIIAAPAFCGPLPQ